MRLSIISKSFYLFLTFFSKGSTPLQRVADMPPIQAAYDLAGSADIECDLGEGIQLFGCNSWWNCNPLYFPFPAVIPSVFWPLPITFKHLNDLSDFTLSTKIVPDPRKFVAILILSYGILIQLIGCAYIKRYSRKQRHYIEPRSIAVVQAEFPWNYYRLHRKVSDWHSDTKATKFATTMRLWKIH